MKVSNIKCKLKHYISTMVICGSYMHEFRVSKDMREKNLTMIKEKGRGSREGGGAFMSKN
jgi:hypothetical protein